MNLGDLQSARSKERQKDSLQHLPENFYADIGAFVEELRTERERAAEAATDPFDAPEVRRLTDDIKTAENTVEAIYERRVGKLVKLASLDAAGMPADEDGLTNEERDLFRTLVEAIESNRAHVLDDVLAGESVPSAAQDSGTEPMDDADTVESVDTPESVEAVDTTNGRASAGETEGGVSAADMMGTDGSEPSASELPGSDVSNGKSVGDEPPADEPLADAQAEANRVPAGADDTGGETPERDTDRTTVRITRDVGEIFGVDERTYHLAAEDIVTLPEVNATPLLERDAAEQLD